MRRYMFYLFSTCTLLISGFFILFSADVSEAKPVKRKNIEKLISRLMAQEHVPGEIIVKYKSKGASDRVSKRMRKRVGAGLKRKFRGKRAIELIKLRSGKSMTDALETYLRDPNVEYAEPNYYVYTALSPDDPDFTEMWGLHNTGQPVGTDDADIDAPEAWDITTGSDSVVIAVIDTGIAFNHADLAANIWTNTGEDLPACNDGQDNDGNGYIDDCYGWDFVENDNEPADLTGHGTLVAGTIAAAGNNSTGITGVMWDAQIMPLRALGLTGAGTVAEVTAAIHYANANGADVINNSWGGKEFSQTLKEAIEASNAVVVCAAGNGGDDGIGYDIDYFLAPFYPASYDSDNIIAVAATDHNDGIASYSNYGATSVDVGAPGDSIYSTIPELSLGEPVTVYGEEGFEGETGGLPIMDWDRGGTNSTWAVTSGTGVGDSNSLEDSPGGDYLENTESWAGYMYPVTSVKDNLYTLAFMWRGEIQNIDAFQIKYSLDTFTWTPIEYRTGSTGGVFISDSTDVYTDIAERFDSFYFGFGIRSGSRMNMDGIYIDDVQLVRAPISVTDFTYTHYGATSMAAAHVSGIAGLVKAYNPSLTNIEIKNVILNSVDQVASLEGNVLTGGRVNAFSALDAACQNLPVSNLSTLSQYSSVQEAYGNAAIEDTIRIQSGVLTENFVAGANKSIALEGGLDCNYENTIGVTAINGNFSINDGELTMEGIALQ